MPVLKTLRFSWIKAINLITPKEIPFDKMRQGRIYWKQLELSLSAFRLIVFIICILIFICLLTWVNYSCHFNEISFIGQTWPNGWVFVYKLSGSGFESNCSHLNFRFRAYFEQWVPRHSGNYGVWIYSETRMWHDKNT